MKQKRREKMWRGKPCRGDSRIDNKSGHVVTCPYRSKILISVYTGMTAKQILD